MGAQGNRSPEYACGVAKKIDFDHAANDKQFSSHTDIAVTKNSKMITIVGGNVSHSVHSSTNRLKSDDKLACEKGLITTMNNRFA